MSFSRNNKKSVDKYADQKFQGNPIVEPIMIITFKYNFVKIGGVIWLNNKKG